MWKVLEFCFLLPLILPDMYFGVIFRSLQFLLYHLAAVVLCSRLLLFLNSCIAFACLSDLYVVTLAGQISSSESPKVRRDKAEESRKSRHTDRSFNFVHVEDQTECPHSEMLFLKKKKDWKIFRSI